MTEDNYISGISSINELTTTRKIEIPYGIVGICADMFNTSLTNLTSLANSISSVYIPSSIKVIGDRAFKGLSSVSSFTVEEGISVDYLGANCISGMSSTDDVSFKR